MSDGYMIVAPVQYAMLQAFQKWDGADRRRLKREVNKAMRKARKSPPSKR